MNPIFLNRTSYITNSWLQSSYGYQVATSTRYRETRYFRITSTHNTNSFLPGTMVPGILVSIPACLTLDTSFHSQREFKILSDRMACLTSLNNSFIKYCVCMYVM